MAPNLSLADFELSEVEAFEGAVTSKFVRCGAGMRVPAATAGFAGAEPHAGTNRLAFG